MALLNHRCSTWVLANVLAVLCLTLSGCGGGGGSPTPAPTTAPPTTSAPTTAPPSTTSTTSFSYKGFKCESDLVMKTTAQIEKKGFCLDDSTFKDCPDNMIGLWPHTHEKVTSLRLFKAWNDEWGDEKARDKAWASLQKFVTMNDVKVFFGTGVTCDAAADDKDWETVLKLMKLLGSKHVLALGVGNEMDIMWRWPGVSQDCLDDIWSNGRFMKMLKKRVADMDSNGFSDAKITTVWGMSAIENKPFKEDQQAKVNSLVTQAYNEFKSRFIWTFNIYAIWDTSLSTDPGNPHKCDNAIQTALGNYTTSLVKACRERIQMVTGNTNDPFWVGETGWSSPHPDGASLLQRNCPDFCSKDTFKKIYEKFLAWDLSIADVSTDFAGPERAFYFAMRNSDNMDMNEYFGLVNKCNDTKCKLTGDNWISNRAVTV